MKAKMVTSSPKNERRATNEALFHPLFEGALAGDQKAYSELFKHIAALAKRYVRKKLKYHEDADDLAQEILISVYKALHTYDSARPCMPWLGAIMHYRLTDWLRSRYTLANQKHVPLEDIEKFLTDTVTEEPLAYEYVTKAVGQLPEKQKAVIHAMYHQELSVAETSAKLDMSVSAVKVTAHRAYKKLRERLEEK